MVRSNVLPFAPRPPARPAHAVDARPVVDLLLVMEEHPWAEPFIVPAHGFDRIERVKVRVASWCDDLSADQARLAADSLVAEQAFPGCIAVAARLRDAAALCDARNAPADVTPIHAGVA